MQDTELKAQVSSTLDDYFDRRVPLHIRDKLALQYRWRGNSVTVIERRPYFRDPSEWTSSPIARFRCDATARLWFLDCPDRNGRWHEFTPESPSPRFQVMLDALDEDVTGIFWG